MDTTPFWVLACEALVLWIVLIVVVVLSNKKEF